MESNNQGEMHSFRFFKLLIELGENWRSKNHLDSLGWKQNWLNHGAPIGEYKHLSDCRACDSLGGLDEW